MLMLDTNVVSEMMKPEPDERLRAWYRRQQSSEMCISVISIGETVYGLQKMPEGKRKDQMSHWFEVDFLEWIGDRIYPVSESIIRDWALIKAQSRTLPVVDSLLAATALAAGATLVTRNAKDFAGIDGLRVVNPWEE